MPIWPDLYEEKGYLLVENQLIYAIIQLDKHEGQTKLQCRWLDDLTKVDENMIQSCDTAYDRAKMQVKMNGYREKRVKETPKTAAKKNEVKKEKPSSLLLHIDAETVRLSHVLEIKNIFRSSPGPDSYPLRVSFKGCTCRCCGN